MIKPWPHQRKAIEELRNGSILVADTGTGKSVVGLVYYIEKVLGGRIEAFGIPPNNTPLYIITTPKKRDEFDWQFLASSFGISDKSGVGTPNVNMVVDSWNNLKKYVGIKNAFFIFDEQRAIGSGTWARSFIKVAKQNRWIMLTATPADTWMDLIPVFIAHGYYKNRTEFIHKHVVYSPHTKFPKIVRYVDERKLERIRERLYVYMLFKKPAEHIVLNIKAEYDLEAIKNVQEKEWNPYKDKPIYNLSEFTSVCRKIINSHPSRIEELVRIFEKAKKLIVFYNFNYELVLLKNAFSPLCEVSEYNGHKHDPLPDSESWVYLVQYMSGSEAWECFTTNHLAFYSLHYSFRITKQAMGRISRLTTEYETLYFYKITSDSFIDKAIMKAHTKKRRFNERELYTSGFYKGYNREKETESGQPAQRV